MNSISIFKQFTKVVGQRSLDAIIQAIKSSIYKEQILQIRKAENEGKSKLKDQLKKQLLAFTISGQFEKGRTLDTLQKYNPYIVLDIDKLSIEALHQVKEKTERIAYSHAGFISPSGKGYKIIVKTNANQKEHETVFKQILTYYETQLNIKIDPSGKDITRLCFMSWDEAAFINKSSKTFEVLKLDNKKLITPKDKSYSKALKKCLAFTKQKSSYVEGNRNNFIYLFASNCNRVGVPIQQTIAYSKDSFNVAIIELEKTINSAYKHHQKETRTKQLKMVEKETTQTIPETSSILETLKQAPFLPDTIFNKLPDILRKGCNVFDDRRERDVFLTGALAVLSGCTPNVSGLYDRAINYPNIFSFVIAPAASGKGAMKYAKMLGDAYHKHLLEESQEAFKAYKIQLSDYQQSLARYKKHRRLSPPEEPTEPPFRILFIPANSSSAMVIKHLKDSTGSGIMCETEADTLGNTLKQDWGGYSDLLRKAFHFEKMSYSRKSNEEFFEIDEPRLSVAISGTPNQVLRLIPSTEDGLFSRFLFYVFSVKSKWRDVSPNCRRLNLTEHFQKLSELILEMALFLEANPTTVKLTAEHWKLVNQTFATMLRETNAFVDQAAESSIKRLGVILFRIAMIFTALRKFETKNKKTELTCRDDDFINAIKLIESYREHAVLLFDRLPKPRRSTFNELPNNKRLFYEALPNLFQRKEAVDIGIQFGVTDRTITRYLKSLVESSFLKQPKYGLYEKGQPV